MTALSVGDDLDLGAASRALVLQLADSGPSVTLDDLLQRPAWQRDAACIGADPAIFFPGRGEDLSPAQAICAACLCQDECRSWALEQGAELRGVWGGLGWRERLQIRTGRARPEAGRRVRQPADHGTLKRYRQGCKCEPCRAANREYAAVWKARRTGRPVKRATTRPSDPVVCGTQRAYARGCRCDACRTVNNQGAAARKESARQRRLG